MEPKILRTSFLITLIALSSVISFFIFRPFLIILAFAMICALMLQPLYRTILRPLPHTPGLASFLTILIAVVCILLPLTYLSTQIVGDAQNLYTSLSDGSGESYLNTVFQYGNGVVGQYAPSMALSGAELSASIDQYMKNGLMWLIENLGGAFGGISSFFLSFFIFLIALYYMLRDGAKLKQILIKASPLGDSADEAVLKRLENAVHSVIRGSLSIALIQGILTGIGFSIFGVPNSILWGVVAAFAALVPGIGTSLVLAPGVVYLFLIGATTPATGLLIWSVFAVGLIDNLLGPKLVGKGMQLHPLIVLLSVFGGLIFFGPSGIFLGPLSTSLLFALVSIYPDIRKQAS